MQPEAVGGMFGRETYLFSVVYFQLQTTVSFGSDVVWGSKRTFCNFPVRHLGCHSYYHFDSYLDYSLKDNGFIIQS